MANLHRHAVGEYQQALGQAIVVLLRLLRNGDNRKYPGDIEDFTPAELRSSANRLLDLVAELSACREPQETLF